MDGDVPFRVMMVADGQHSKPCADCQEGRRMNCGGELSTVFQGRRLPATTKNYRGGHCEEREAREEAHLHLG
eukprot:scaffold147707_cov31-Tisochrysis_lutea.AAC.1